jgi:protein TonB
VALGVSAVLHALAVWLLVHVTESDWNRTPTPGAFDLSRAAGGGGGGGGGAEIHAFVLPAPPSAPKATAPTPTKAVVPPPEVPKPTPKPVEKPAVEAQVAPAAPSSTTVATTAAGAGTGPGSGGGSGGGQGGGVGPGTGPGVGPGSGGGQGGTATPPVQQQMIIPPVEGVPKELRGITVSVTFWVRADGSVANVVIAPEIKHGDYERRFREAMLAYHFKPARSAAGLPIDGTFTQEVTIGG